MKIPYISAELFTGLESDTQKSYLVKHVYNEESTVKTVCSFYNVYLDDLITKERRRKMVYPRQVAMYLLTLKYPLIGNPTIGKIFNRDRTTVTYAVNTINDLMSYDKKVRADIQALKELIF